MQAQDARTAHFVEIYASPCLVFPAMRPLQPWIEMKMITSPTGTT